MNRNSLSRRIRRAVTAAAAIFLLLCACAAAGGETVTARPSVNGALHVEAGRLTDESGETVQLRGVSTHGLTWYPQFVSENLFRQVAEDWNGNLIRLAMQWANIEPEPGCYSERYLASIDGIFRLAEQYGVYILLDSHQDL